MPALEPGFQTGRRYHAQIGMRLLITFSPRYRYYVEIRSSTIVLMTYLMIIFPSVNVPALTVRLPVMVVTEKGGAEYAQS